MCPSPKIYLSLFEPLQLLKKCPECALSAIFEGARSSYVSPLNTRFEVSRYQLQAANISLYGPQDDINRINRVHFFSDVTSEARKSAWTGFSVIIICYFKW